MPTLQIQLLGHFHLSYEGVPATTLYQARSQSLLAYVALHQAAPVPRQQLSFLFWPDATEAQARANLRKALYDLRHLLPAVDQFLDVQNHYLRWRDGVTVDLDVTTFEQLLVRARQASLPQAVLGALEQAVAIYTGDLLPACYDDWVMHDRERLRQHYVTALDRLIQLLEERRAYSAALVHAQHLLQADPLQEATYRTLMHLHLRNGNRAHALQVYHTCATVLQQELEVEPSPETQAAYQRLLNMQEASTTTSTTEPGPKGEFPLVGRHHEWEALRRAWRAACHGQQHFVLIAGEAGIGKTRLADELLQWADQQGYATAKSRSYAAEGQLAYAPVADWLRTDRIRERLGQLQSVWLSEVARLLPELLVEHPDLTAPQPLADSWQRQHFRAALARAFTASEQPLLLVLDDLQWCDRETLEWLHYLLRFAAELRLLVVGTVRSEEIAEDHPLVTFTTHLRQEGKLLELELAPLDPDETAALAAVVAGHPLDAEQSAAVYTETEGHPLFVVEMIRAREVGAGAVLPASAAGIALAPKMQSIIHARLLQLSPAARELAGWAAVVGRAFTVEVLVHAGAGGEDTGEDTLVPGLDELWRRRIIREHGTQGYDFSHDKIREAVYAGISPARRRLHHRQVAQALEAVYALTPDDVSGQIAAHYELAGLAEKASFFYQRAAEVSQRVYAHAAAQGYIEQAFKQLLTLPPTPKRERQELQLQLALGVSLTALLGSSAPEIYDVYKRASELAAQLGDEAEYIVALAGLFVNALATGRPRLAYDLAQQCLVVAQRLGDPNALVEARGRTGVCLLHLGEWQASRNSFEQALAQEEYRWDPSLALRWVQHQGLTIRLHYAAVLWHLGYPDQAEKTINENLALAQALGHPYSLAMHLSWSCWLYYFRREPQLARAQAEWGIALCQKHGFRYVLGQCMVVEGWALAQQGQAAAGITRMQQGISSRLALNAQVHRPGFLAMLAETYGLAGQPEHGLSLLGAAVDQVAATGESMSLAELHRLKGELLWKQGAGDQEVESCLLRALSIARQQEAKSLELRAAMSLGRLWQQQKRQRPYDLLAEVYHWFAEGFDTPDLIAAKDLLARLP